MMERGVMKERWTIIKMFIPLHLPILLNPSLHRKMQEKMIMEIGRH